MRRLLRPILVGGERRSEFVAIAVYLVVSPISTVLGTLVGSLSEYRFPHPLLTTTLHLLISLATVLLASLGANYGLKLLAPRRLNDAPSKSPFLRSITAGFELLAGQANRSESISVRRQIRLRITPLSLSCALASVLAALVEMSATKITETTFWSTARLLPLLLIVTLSATTYIIPSSTTRDAGQGILAMLLFIVFLAGPSTGVQASSQGWLAGVGYAGAVASWVVCIQVDKRERDRETNKSNCIIAHLALCSVLLLSPLLLSHEIGAAFQSGHFGFFTEVGFWAQEVVLAWCALVKLVAFWNLVEKLDAATVFIVVAFKDWSIPFLYHFLFSNPFPDTQSSALSPRQQLFSLVLIGTLYLANSTPTSSPSTQREPTKTN